MKTRSNWVAIEMVRTLTIYMLIDIDIDIFEAITFIVVPYVAEETSKISSQPDISLKSSVSPRQRWVLEAVESPTVNNSSRLQTHSTGKHHRNLSNEFSSRNLIEQDHAVLKPTAEMSFESPVNVGTQSRSRKHLQLAQQLAQANQYQDLQSDNGGDFDNHSSGDSSLNHSPIYEQQSSSTAKFSDRFSSGVVAPAPVDPPLSSSLDGGSFSPNSLSDEALALTPLRIPPESSTKASAQSSRMKRPTSGNKRRLAAVITTELEVRLDR